MEGPRNSVRPGTAFAAAGFATALVLTALLAGRGLAQAWSLAPDLGHGWALPWLMGWLVRERLTTSPGSERARAPGLRSWVFLGCGLVIYAGLRLFLEPFPLWPSVLWMLAGLLYAYLLAGVWLAGGMTWIRLLAGPLALVFTAIPWPGVVENALLHPLRQGLATSVAEVLNLLSVPAFAEGTVIRISGGVVGVDEACGGMRSLQTALMIGWFVGELAGMTLARRFLLLMGAALAAVGGNFLRALALTWLMDAGGEELLNRWHDPAGYLALASTLMVVLLLGWWWRPRGETAAASPRGDRLFPRATVVWAMVSLAGCVVVEAGVRGWFGSREREVALTPSWSVAWPRQEIDFRAFPLGERAREMLQPDDFSSAAWRTADGRERSGYYILWETGQHARNAPFLHSPEVCLPLTGIELAGREATETVDVAGARLPFEVYRFRQHGRLMYVFRVVWDPDGKRAASAPGDADGWNRWFGERWADVAARRIAVRAQVLTLAISGESDRDEALRAFREELARIVRADVREK